MFLCWDRATVTDPGPRTSKNTKLQTSSIFGVGAIAMTWRDGSAMGKEGDQDHIGGVHRKTLKTKTGVIVNSYKKH